MNNNKKLPKTLFWAIPLVVVLVLIAILVINQAEQSRNQITVIAEVPDFNFVDQDGDPFGREQLLAKITIVDFIFTSCPGVCIPMAERYREFYKLYQGSDKIQFVSISVDPARDSLLVLQQYADKQGVTDQRWKFLSAPIDEVAELMEAGFMLSAENLPAGHPSKFILVDEQAQIRSYFEYNDEKDIELLKLQIKELASRL